MGKRRFGRTSTNLPVDVYWGGELQKGVVTNLSGNGMYIESGICFASGSDIEVVLIVRDEVYNISGKVKRTENSNGSSGGMGVEFLCPSINHRQFGCIVQNYAYKGPCLMPCVKRSKRVSEKVAS
jgi:hypothetical protein